MINIRPRKVGAMTSLLRAATSGAVRGTFAVRIDARHANADYLIESVGRAVLSLADLKPSDSRQKQINEKSDH
ncbi:unnamed protein product, partial [Iphiclides podalirius]